MRVFERQLSSDAVSRLRTDGSGTTTETGPSCPGDLIMVSNRQPYRHTYESDGERQSAGTSATERSITVDEPTGGLTAGLDPVVQQTNGTWIAWGDGEADFAVTDDRDCVEVPPDEPEYTLRRIPLSEEAVDSYYRGFSNRVLWPLCHEFLDVVENRSNDFEWYRTINEQFADRAVEHATPESVIWLQDYHLALAPRLIDRRVPSSVTIAQFWHIPWPTAETFRYCPAGERILRGLLGNDLLGFHIDRYADYFLESVDRYCSGAVVDWHHRTVQFEGTQTRIVATPLGIDAQSHADDARDAATTRTELLESFDVPPRSTIGLGVDRLDYTKGIPERLAAIECFFERNPSWEGEFTFIQTATPSRTEIDAYEQYGELVRSEVERINRRFGRGDWKPIVYTEEFIEPETLAALYRHADVMIVSPLLDGMNLVAQEFIASSIDADSCLVLSDRTGAHELLGSETLSVDPTETIEFTAQLERALTMSPDERRRRMTTLRTRVFDGDLDWWMQTQFDLIAQLHTHQAGDGTDSDDSEPPERTRPA